MTLHQRFADAVRSYEGVPSVPNGRSREGVDCIGLVICALRDIGLEPADEVYELRPEFDFMERALVHFPALFEQIAFDHIADAGKMVQTGDVLALRLPRVYQHFAVVTSPGFMTHSYFHSRRTVHSVVTAPYDHSVLSRIHSVWRLRTRE